MSDEDFWCAIVIAMQASTTPLPVERVVELADKYLAERRKRFGGDDD